MAPTLLLETKLYAPPPPRGLVPRSRLIEQLDAGTASRLMLVSAPAGFGKTTLLAAWLAARPAAPAEQVAASSGYAVAWVSLGQGDSQPQTFWSYVVAALQRVAPGVGETARVLLQAVPPAPTATVLTTLLNDVGSTDGDIVLVLDDYHVIDSADVHEGMAFLVDHSPPQLHVVVAGRADPALPLARLRARGELVEVRAADLRFTPEEAATYLNGVMGLKLTVADVAALESRTEGWIAALQLAALSMQGRGDVAEFIAGFAGDARYVVDYLVEDVLARQPEDVQTFLLQTSVLDRLSGALCDAVTERSGGQAMLDSLDRANLFLVPLDDRRRWYRYHHLFADMLRARLLDEQPDLVHLLHRRASAWYEENGDLAVAIDHSLAGGDFDRAADLVELAAPSLRRLRQESTLRAWMDAIPDAQFQVRPVLSNDYVGSLMATGEIDGVEPYLRNAERWLAAISTEGRRPQDRPQDMVVVDEEGFQTLPTRVAMHRAGQALMLGDRTGCVTHARRALDLASEDDHLGRAAASALIGLAAWGDGDVAAAQAGYTESWTHMQRAGHIADVLGLAVTLGDLHVVQGRLRDAMRTYEEALRLAAVQDGPVLRGTADMYVGMAALHRERNDLATANELLLRCEELGEHLGLPQNPHRWRVATARVREAEGDLDAAAHLLADADRVYAGDFSPDVRPIPAMRARLSIAQGKLDEARRWARERGLSSQDDVSYLHEFDHVTLARLLLAEYRRERLVSSGQQALELLQRLLQAAEDGGRTGTVLEILVLQALGHQSRGDTLAALAPLERALTLAAPEDYVRIFTDEGPPMHALLTAAAQRGIATAYVRRLMTSFDETRARRTPAAGMVEPLSDRELDVLRLLATDLGGPDIARELVLSLNTVRTHTKNIYTKLGVNNRRAAVRRATELDLLHARR
ncbi:MAG TPA: LuxR C-terminal-related transcriptional regulator [Actinomycetes bacterium]|nr:LuxR C-terminal-related transcriptional regulator [Actinomycetes bacterium]